MDQPGPAEVLDERIARLTALLADRDQQLRDRWVVDDLAARADTLEAQLQQVRVELRETTADAAAQRARADLADHQLAGVRDELAAAERTVADLQARWATLPSVVLRRRARGVVDLARPGRQPR